MHYYEKANYILQRFNSQDKLHIYGMKWLKRMNSIKVVGHNVTVSHLLEIVLNYIMKPTIVVLFTSVQDKFRFH